MSLESLLARGRAAAEALMVDTCTIRRQGAGAVDDNTGVITPSRTVVYEGACRLQVDRASAQALSPGEDHQLLVPLVVQLPVAGSEGLRPGDEVEMTACQMDADVVGQVLLVRALHAKSHATSRRLAVTRRTS